MEILSLFDRISRLTTSALTAADHADLEVITRILDERQLLFGDVIGQVRRLAVLREECSARETPDFDRLATAIDQIAHEIQEIDEFLAARLAEQGNRVTAVWTNSAARAHQAYRHVPWQHRLDLVR
jgi:hypothetical protein